MSASLVRYAVAFALGARGFAHIVGFPVSWRLMSSVDTPYVTTLLAERLDVGGTGIRLVGVLWLLTAGSSTTTTAPREVPHRRFECSL